MNKGDKQSFRSVLLKEECNGMTCDFSVINMRDTHLIDILLIKFSGEYRPGSQGKAESGYLVGMVKLGIEVWRPFKVAIDLQDVKYEWGDDMALLFDAPEDLKTVVIVGKDNKRAISTLLYGIDTDKDAVDNKFFFDEFARAIDKLKKMK
ncbi:MAG: hypothetical protein HEP71_24855 [Roseivirga sp.]|nr:hypothetical protein [Roseivirga sp.]